MDKSFVLGAFAGGVVGLAIGGILLGKAKAPSIPTEYQQILNRYRVEFHVWEGAPEGFVKTVPRIDPNLADVKVLAYEPYSKTVDAEGNVVFEQFDIFTLGIEDLNVKDGMGRFHAGDDWKDFIVSIRRVKDYTTSPPSEAIWVSFQPSYSHAIVYDNITGEKVYETYTDPTDVTLVHAIPKALYVQSF
ncbi:hypothetical protein DRP04_08255 [Archaeoglobales archaeon]|nr:MAG: hypothetical protein DRP04_08255 [Archaeoglobales archaeon]